MLFTFDFMYILIIYEEFEKYLITNNLLRYIINLVEASEHKMKKISVDFF